MKCKRTIVSAGCCAVGIVAGVIGTHLLRPPRPRQERVVVLAPPMVVRPPSDGGRIPIIGAPPALLRWPVGEFRSDGDRLSDVIDRLRDRSGADIFVNWKALAAPGVTHDLPVTFRSPGPTLADVLDDLLIELCGSGNGPRLGYDVDEDVITISTSEDLSKNTLTRVYDIRDFLRAADSRDDRDKAVAAVVRTVTGVDPLSWRDHGGKLGMVRELGGQLVVTQTPAVHRRLRDLLGPNSLPSIASDRKPVRDQSTNPAARSIWASPSAATRPSAIRDRTRTR